MEKNADVFFSLVFAVLHMYTYDIEVHEQRGKLQVEDCHKIQTRSCKEWSPPPEPLQHPTVLMKIMLRCPVAWPGLPVADNDSKTMEGRRLTVPVCLSGDLLHLLFKEG